MIEQKFSGGVLNVAGGFIVEPDITAELPQLCRNCRERGKGTGQFHLCAIIGCPIGGTSHISNGNNWRMGMGVTL